MDDDSAQRPEASRDLAPRILDNLIEGCQLIAPDYRYLYVNEAVARHGRTTREDLVGRHMAVVYPGIEETEMFSVLRGCMDERVPAQMENEFVFPDGSTGWFELRFEPVPDGVAILSADITDRKQAEVALDRTLRALRTLSRCNQVVVRAEDEQRLLRDICASVVDVAGYPMVAVDLIGPGGELPLRPVASAAASEPLRELLRDPCSRCPWWESTFGRAVDRGEPETCDLSHPHDDSWADRAGALGIASCLLLPMRRRGSCVGALTIFSTEQQAFDERERAVLDEVALDLGYGIESLRARAEHAQVFEELAQAQARTRAIYDHLPHPTFVWRRGPDGWSLVDFNEPARAATDEATLPGLSARELADGVPHIENDLAETLETHEVIRREMQCVLPGTKQPRRLALTYGFIPPDMVLLQAQDVTEQRQTEEQLVAAQRLEAVGRLAGGVAHDFNNLLSVILSYAGFALEQIEDSNPAHGDIAQVHDAGQRAATLTKRLLAFSRKQVLEPQVTNLSEVVRGVENMLRRLLGEDIDIVVRAASDVGNVVADPSQIEQIIMNLAVNARDAMPQGGKLTITTDNVEIDDEYVSQHVSSRPGPYVRLSVADTGTGMDEETRQHLFEPFYTTKEMGKGTGLGLSMVYGTVKQSGGNIWVYSELGHGTTFKIYLPRVDAEAIERRRSVSPTTATGTETVLVVEDEDTVRRAAGRILRRAGYEVLSAGSGEEALRLCDEHRAAIDLLLTDVVMPEMNGREVAEQLRAQNPALKVLFTSGYTDDAIIHHGVLDADTWFLSKPFTLSELTNKVRQVLDEG